MAKQKKDEDVVVESGTADSTTSPEPPKPKPKVEQRVVRAGGHEAVIEVPAPGSSKPSGLCSVHGVPLNRSGKCPQPHEGRGWKVP